MLKEPFKITPISKDIFSVFVALNVMGYDDENNPKGMSSIRKSVRKNLMSKQDWRKNYPKLYKIIRINHPWYLLKKVLEKNDQYLKEFGVFFKDEFVQKEWKRFQIYRKNELIKINKSSIKNEMDRFISCVKRSNDEIKKIEIIINPLDAYWRGYSIKIDNVGYIVVGPGFEKNHYELIRHELLHLFTYSFKIPSELVSIDKHKNAAKTGYISTKIIHNEYIIRALNLMYERNVLKRDIKNEIQEERKNFPNIGKVIRIIENG